MVSGLCTRYQRNLLHIYPSLYSYASPHKFICWRVQVFQFYLASCDAGTGDMVFLTLTRVWTKVHRQYSNKLRL